jgi:hypothetical protein
MRIRTLLIPVASVAVLGAWYAFRPERVFINARVNESLPEYAAPTAMASGMSAKGSMMPTHGDASMPAAISSGKFHSFHHETSGLATVYRLADGSRIVRFTDFSTSNGPDVRVYLVAADDATDNGTVEKAGYIELGPMKGNQGDQNYRIPADVDLSKYRAVTIWCKRFAVNFATAPLAG